MKTLRYIALGAVASAALGVATARADDSSSMNRPDVTTKTTKERATNLKPSEQRTAELVVKDVDQSNHKATFEAKISPEANFMENGSKIKMDQLKPGDTVRVSFDPKTGDVIKVEVTKMGSSNMDMKDMNK